MVIEKLPYFITWKMAWKNIFPRDANRNIEHCTIKGEKVKINIIQCIWSTVIYRDTSTYYNYTSDNSKIQVKGHAKEILTY